MSDAVRTSGSVAAGFEGVAEEFERNFAERAELGAAFAAIRGDEVLVDPWGGLADRAAGRPWSEDTLQLIFSGAKGIVAVCMLLLHERDQLDFDVPVARYWPEFDKPDVMVRDIVGHTARLPGIERPLTIEEFVDHRCISAQLVAQPRSEDPRTLLCYTRSTTAGCVTRSCAGSTGEASGSSSRRRWLVHSALSSGSAFRRRPSIVSRRLS